MNLKSEYEAQRPKSSRARIYLPSGRTILDVAGALNRSDKSVYEYLRGRPIPQNIRAEFLELAGFTEESFAIHLEKD